MKAVLIVAVIASIIVSIQTNYNYSDSDDLELEDLIPASYGEPCRSPLLCSRRRGLQCVEGFCKCEDEHKVHIMFEGCLTPPTIDNDFDCSTGTQCKFYSTYGFFSTCDPQTNKCACDHPRDLAVEVNNTCVVPKAINVSCYTNSQCQLGTKGDVICIKSENSSEKICQCASGSIYQPLRNSCLKLGSINSTCKFDTQCNDSHSLGSLGYCDLTTAKCKCKGIKNGIPSETGYLDGKCYFIRGINETCNSREECVLGYGENAECLVHPAYNDEKICNFPPNKNCSGNAFQVSVGAFVIGIVAHFLKSRF